MSGATSKRSRPVLVSICSNAGLLVIKVAAGVATGSVSILSEAAHSATDLVASLIAFFAIRGSETPPDEMHHYGHGRFENLAGLFEGLVLLGVGLWVVIGSAGKILNGSEIEFVGIGVAVMAFSATVNFFVSRWLLRVAREADSKAMEAEGYNLLTDVWGAGGVALGLVAVYLTGWTVLDPIIAVLIGIAILWTALRLVITGARVLADESLPPNELRVLEDIIGREIAEEPTVRGFHKLRARKSGPQRHIDFHLQFYASTTLGEAHRISDRLEGRIAKGLPQADVLIHLEDDRSLSHGKPDGTK